MTLFVHYEIDVAESAVVACHRTFGISAKEVKLCYWQNNLGGLSSTLALDKHSAVACEVRMATLQPPPPCEGPSWNQQPIFAMLVDQPIKEADLVFYGCN